MILKCIFYYSLTVLGITSIVALFSKRKAILAFSAIFVLFFAFFNFFSTNLILFFINCQNFLFSLYDTIFDKLRILTEQGGSNLLKRVGMFVFSLLLALMAIRQLPFALPAFIICFYSTITPFSTAFRYHVKNTQHISLLFEHYLC